MTLGLQIFRLGTCTESHVIGKSTHLKLDGNRLHLSCSAVLVELEKLTIRGRVSRRVQDISGHGRGGRRDSWKAFQHRMHEQPVSSPLLYKESDNWWHGV